MPPPHFGASPISGMPELTPGGLATGPSPPRRQLVHGENVASARDALAPRLPFIGDRQRWRRRSFLATNWPRLANKKFSLFHLLSLLEVHEK
ncbi:uncharacterized protein LOC110189700 isoform X2 [Drosophila serrata]|uniref:uncharacterized protein LOC110189681 isoform X2 n=1 Tax=Drosophila serrata TaxID=7274 RepID=UPI000A1CFD57|nr:uncharacterized protein LOC110189681 isoform X2 [Drosophila serrata]XP_020815534.1 uncharacterized protein LOC110189700 isoform X2 [Drosophila serrata]